MINTAKYEVELRIDGVLLGNIRNIAQNLAWSKQRTRVGVDTISFTVNDLLLARWCEMRGTTIAEILRPLALDCRVIRNGVPVVGGFLATMPAYQPKGSSADLQLKFDGYLNFLANVYLSPAPRISGKLGELIEGWITEADNRAEAAGKAFGFTAGNIGDFAVIQQTVENYTAIKDIITNRCDNTTGAGPFDVVFHPDRSYDIIPDSKFGDVIDDYIIQYPTKQNGVSATGMSAKEISGFASTVIGIGGGDVSDGSEESSEDEAIISTQTNNEAVTRYGYAETILQESSVSVQETLDRNVATELAGRSSMIWQPEAKLIGTQVAPVPTGKHKIWIGDTVTIQNSEDQTGMASGSLRVNALSVSVAATGAETITPSLSRGDAINTNSFAKDIVRMRNELLALKTSPTSRGQRNMV